MKTGYFLIILCFLIPFAGCSNSQDVTVAQTTVQNIGDENQYTFAIIQTKGSSTQYDQKCSYSGSFELVVQNDKGAEISRQSLNHFFDKQELFFDGPIDLILNDYNNDGLFDIPIGFPAGDGSNEYQYVLFSVGNDGELFSLPVIGYKEDGFVYTPAGAHSIDFTKTTGVGQDVPPGMLIGVEKEDGSFEPAKYVWNGERFEFEKERPFIITEKELNIGNEEYSIIIIQTEYKKPLTPDDQDFTIYESIHRGRFDLLIQNSSGEITSRVTLNEYFGNDDLGSGGSFPLVFEDYNKDGNLDFAFGSPAKDIIGFQYVLFSINPDGTVYRLQTVGYKEDGFIYDASDGAMFSLLEDGEIGFKVTLGDNGWSEGKYIWNGNEFVFSKSTN